MLKSLASKSRLPNLRGQSKQRFSDFRSASSSTVFGAPLQKSEENYNEEQTTYTYRIINQTQTISRDGSHIGNSTLIQRRHYSMSSSHESATLVMGLGALACTAKAGQYAVSAYQEYKANLPEEPESASEDNKADFDSSTTTDSNQAPPKEKSGSSGSSKTRENIFSSYFSVGSKYYEGGFEEKMTRREAALILGVRESSTEKRIKEAHRKLLILNHPDTGGSTYISGKLNEAKDLLLKAKGR